MQPGVLDSCQRALRRLERSGCRIEPVAPQALGVPLQALWECWLVLRTVAAAPPLFGHLRKARELMKPEAIWEAERGLAMSAREVAEASQVRTTLLPVLAAAVQTLRLPGRCRVRRYFPSTPRVHWPAEVGGRSMDTYHRWMEVVIYATLTGSPAISMPVPLADPAGMPALGDLAGIQLVGRAARRPGRAGARRRLRSGRSADLAATDGPAPKASPARPSARLRSPTPSPGASSDLSAALFQRGSGAPLRYQLEPLSARIMP